MVALANKFIIKPQAALKGMTDLQATLESQAVSFDSETEKEILSKKLSASPILGSVYENLCEIVKKIFAISDTRNANLKL